MNASMVHLAAAIASLTLIMGSTSSAAQPESSPVAIEDDPIVTIARTAPDAVAQVVVGEAGVYVRMEDEEWMRSGDAPDGQLVVAASDDPALILAGEEVMCLRDAGTTPMQRSDDGGETWDEVADTAGVWPLAIEAESGLGVAASCSGLLVTTDAGLIWTATDSTEPGLEVTSSAVIVDDTDEFALLVGLTSEGGSSSLVRLDVTPAGDVTVTPPMREYWGVGALAGVDETYVVGAADGVWMSTDEGESWSRTSNGLDEAVLDQDPNVAGLPMDVEPGSFGVTAVWPIVDLPGTFVIGTADGAFVTADIEEGWIMVPGVSGAVEWLQPTPDGLSVLVELETGVVDIDLASRSD